MKTKMKMLENGNFEQVTCPIQHKCTDSSHILTCTEYSWKSGLELSICEGDPSEGGYEVEFVVNFCPFCGYKGRSNA